jgi:hypothetical protein
MVKDRITLTVQVDKRCQARKLSFVQWVLQVCLVPAKEELRWLVWSYTFILTNIWMDGK